ncbi:MAG: hypothetical protein AVDCRST_MAG68-3367 [uncultured Gemmatimonadetes bacterium]|uniref:Uncharacterized protein n=1 Tax=uncultured Gemmatimonadota bacterium TaxID=203437 RepID=A0A6J4LP09_9BACT|nr:MAG: hypothetical protein AVDCRST_MAG68-3367 [uncultured Gemmatimonadota bacterium]
MRVDIKAAPEGDAGAAPAPACPATRATYLRTHATRGGGGACVRLRGMVRGERG